MLDVSSVTTEPANVISEYKTLKLIITHADFAEHGIDSPDLEIKAHCCAWANPKNQFMVVDAVEIGGKKAKKSRHSYEYGNLEEFPCEKATEDFVREVEYMLAQLKR